MAIPVWPRGAESKFVEARASLTAARTASRTTNFPELNSSSSGGNSLAHGSFTVSKVILPSVIGFLHRRGGSRDKFLEVGARALVGPRFVQTAFPEFQLVEFSSTRHGPWPVCS
jgi:hypothetical protein